VTTQGERGRPPSQLTVPSPAKINLCLHISGRRGDGYHEIETVMAPLELADRLTLQLRKTRITLECETPELPADDSNLAVRAARALAGAFNVEKGVKITLAKRIPIAAGLGGGSSNAAAVLQGLNQLWNLGATNETLRALAADIGSDVSFFLGRGAAVCRGRGERVEPAPCRLSATVLLVNPGFGISSRWAYETWSKTPPVPQLTAPPAAVSLLVRALAEDDLPGVARSLFNALERPAIRKFPVLQLLKEAMIADGAAGALMSGSGATVFGLFAERRQAESCGQRIRAEFGPSMWTQVTKCLGA
jgi:4-diphosphocytidyl-2-C-methyl-D-erythritol kinase